MKSSIDKFLAARISGDPNSSLINVMQMGKTKFDSVTHEGREKFVADARAAFDGEQPGRFDSLTEEQRHTATYNYVGRFQLGAYIRTRDLELMKFDGEPVLYEIQRPDPIWLAEEAGAIAHMPTRRMLAFRTWVHLIRQGENGKVLFEAVRPERDGKYTLEQTSTGAWIAPKSYVRDVALFAGNSIFQEMGQAVLDFSELSEENLSPFGFWGGTVAKPSVNG